MPGKRALVVDDSRSARAFLSNLLEEHQLEVDSVESAEQAIDYLAHHRPDVIFMDHLMPGMDGFQAVQAIKGNPRTATIPILMYTSQEGELYMGQARALGAIGVLPKQVAPADVSTVLQQLHLVDSLRSGLAEAELQEAAHEAEALAAPPDNEIAKLRHFIQSSLDAQNDRLLADLRALAGEARNQPPPRVRGLRTMGALALLASAAAVTLGILAWRQNSQLQELRAGALPSAAGNSAAAPAVGAARAEEPSERAEADAVDLRVAPVPWGQAPLDGERTELLREVVGQLSGSGFTGTVEVKRYTGRFCLASDPAGGYALAPATLPYVQCDLVADAGEAGTGPGPTESLAFANALAELRKAHTSIRIDVSEGGESPRNQAYPAVGGTPPRVPTAGEWNDAAQANNRVEIRWRAAP